jgi:FkbM family methyltransferase
MALFQKLIRCFKPYVEKFPRVAIFYRTLRDNLLWDDKPNQTPWGFALAGNDLMARGQFEPMETKIVRDLLNDVDLFVNVGANIGYYCCHALSLQKPVIAFEPIYKNLIYLYKNIKTNGWKDIEIFPIALSSKVDILEIYGGGTGASLVKGWAGGSEIYKTLVPCSTLDLNLENRLNGKKALILVDVEGSERSMLEGALATLSYSPRPVWFIEVAIKEHRSGVINGELNFQEIFELFYGHGYRAFVAEDSGREIFLWELPAILSGKTSLDAHNFIFR